jgi:hypothetical protein
VANKSYTQILPNIYVQLTKNITLDRVLYDFILFFLQKRKGEKRKIRQSCGSHTSASCTKAKVHVGKLEKSQYN